MRGFGIIAASFSSSSVGSKRIARVPSRHGRRRLRPHLVRVDQAASASGVLAKVRLSPL
jgi:hypothetical protein